MTTVDLRLALIPIVIFLSNINILSFGEYSFLVLVVLAFFLIKTIPRLKGGVLVFSFLFAFGFFIPLMANFEDVAKEFIFLLQFIFGFLIFEKSNNVEDIFKFTLKCTLIIALLQWFIPHSESLFLTSLSRFSMPDGIRGASSIFQEPSFYAFFCGATFLILWANAKFRGIDLKIWLLISLNLIAAGSSIGLIVFPFMFIALKMSFKLKLSIFALSFAGILSFIDLNEISIRAVSVLVTVLDRSSEYDTSSSARLFYIIKDLNQFFTCSVFLPTLAAGYQASFELCGEISTPVQFYYDPLLSGSFLGRYLVQFGILTLALIAWLFWRLQGRAVYKILGAIFFCALFIQMIPITFPIVGITLGFLFSKAYYRNGFT